MASTTTGLATTKRNSSVRRLGIALCVLLFVEGALGNLSAGRSGSPALLVAHVVLGLGVVGLALRSSAVARRFPRSDARRAAWLTAAAVVATALTGAIFLTIGFQQGGIIDRVLALVALAGSILMICWGSAP